MVAIDVDEPDGVIVLLLLLLLSDEINGIGVAGRNLSAESKIVSTESLSGVDDMGRRNFCESSILLLHSPPIPLLPTPPPPILIVVVAVSVVNGESVSNFGLLEHGLRLNNGDGVKFLNLGGELSKFKLVLLLLLLFILALPIVLELVLQVIAIG